MDFADSPADAAYRARVRDWLAANAGDYRAPRAVAYPPGEWVARSRAWQKAKHAAGFTGITWPAAMGGQGLSPLHGIIFNEEQSRYHAPAELFVIGLGMCLPTVFTHGSAAGVAAAEYTSFERRELCKPSSPRRRGPIHPNVRVYGSPPARG